MKNYIKDRDKDFFLVCENVIREYSRLGRKRNINMVIDRAILTQAKSFYLSDNRIRNILSNPPTSCLCVEIHNRYVDIISNNPNVSISKAAKIIADQPSPSFFISRDRGIKIYYNYIKSL